MFTAFESTLLLGIPVAVIGYIGYHLLVNPLFSPLRALPGPEAKGWLGFQGHLNKVLQYVNIYETSGIRLISDLQRFLVETRS